LGLPGLGRATPAKERDAILRRWAELMLGHKKDLARIMSREQSKPPAEAHGEIDYGASFLDWFGEEAKRLYDETIPSHLPGSALMVVREPVGVAAITPWDFPSVIRSTASVYAYGSGLRGLMRVAGALDYGMVAINTPKFTGAPVPFGGTKQSGLGREGSRHGTDDYTELKYLCLGGLD
jgi:acyl-CoA reductase-like NAD-dependent aldehyde dehydrogenase